MNTILNKSAAVLAAALLAGFAGVSTMAGDNPPAVGTASVDADAPFPPQPLAKPVPPQPPARAFAFASDNHHRTPVIWLGVGVEETSEALTSQLDLKPGEGLAVTFVSSNSPAGIAGLRKNDVLVELDGQMLVDGAQLRKLVQMHADGDSVKIEFYRAGKKQSASAKLIKQTRDDNFAEGDMGPDNLGNLMFRLNDQHALLEDKVKVDREVQQAMRSAQQAVQEAVRQSMDATDGLDHQLEIIHKKLGNLANGGINLDTSTSVMVKNEGATVRSIVKKDASGTYVIVADPAKRLTAHDAAGKLLFDDVIDSPEQQEKVPKEVWEKVAPMLDQLDHGPVARSRKPAPKNDSQDE
jgi:hypothetical protein